MEQEFEYGTTGIAEKKMYGKEGPSYELSNKLLEINLSQVAITQFRKKSCYNTMAYMSWKLPLLGCSVPYFGGNFKKKIIYIPILYLMSMSKMRFEYTLIKYKVIIFYTTDQIQQYFIVFFVNKRKKKLYFIMFS